MKNTFLSAVLLALAALAANSQNPFVQTWFTSDPAPMVHDGTMYVYTGHDEDNADFFWMQEWRVYSTEDMVNWQDHGSPLALESFSWADDRAWASQTVERDGKFYWYICAHSKISNGMAIGVAVSDSPTGPFKDAIGKPLFENGSWDHIDPTVFIDDDGQAWLMWGNPQCYYLKLNRDMVSYSGELGCLDMTEEAFGGPMMNKREKGKKYKDSYVEGPWLTKRNGVYQLLYAAGGVPEHISYSTAPSPTGPWKYAGEIMPLSETNSFTNHCGVADYKGHSYFFYHTGKLPKGGGFGRSVAVEEFKYNADGSFPTIMPTDEGVKPIETFNPYRKVEAETMAFSRGVKTEQNDEIGVYVSDIHNGDFIKLQNVDFSGNMPKQFVARVASGLRGGQIEVRLDSLKGELLARLEVPGTGGWEKWQTLSTEIVNSKSSNSKCHDIFFAFTGRKGPKLFNFDWWSLSASFTPPLDGGGDCCRRRWLGRLQSHHEGRGHTSCAYRFRAARPLRFQQEESFARARLGKWRLHQLAVGTLQVPQRDCLSRLSCRGNWLHSYGRETLSRPDVHHTATDRKHRLGHQSERRPVFTLL